MFQVRYFYGKCDKANCSKPLLTASIHTYSSIGQNLYWVNYVTCEIFICKLRIRSKTILASYSIVKNVICKNTSFAKWLWMNCVKDEIHKDQRVFGWKVETPFWLSDIQMYKYLNFDIIWNAIKRKIYIYKYFDIIQLH